MQTLVEAAYRLEGSAPTEDGAEEEIVVCPVCGEIFNQSGYKLIVHAFVTQQPIPAAVEEQGQSNWKDGEAPQEKLQQREVADKQGDDTQEPTFLNIPIEFSTQIGISELEDEIIPDFSEEVCAVTLEPSDGTKLIGMEPQ